MVGLRRVAEGRLPTGSVIDNMGAKAGRPEAATRSGNGKCPPEPIPESLTAHSLRQGRQAVRRRDGACAAFRLISHAPGKFSRCLERMGPASRLSSRRSAELSSPPEGSIEYRGQPYRHRPARFGEPQPVAFIHQDLGLVEWMTIAENIALSTGYPRSWGFIDWDAVESATRAALVQVDLPARSRRCVCAILTRTEEIPLVAIARALSVGADVLVLDERLLGFAAGRRGPPPLLRRALRPHEGARGRHDLCLASSRRGLLEIADRIAVLRDGTLVGERLIAETTPDELVSLIVGKALDRFEPSPSPSSRRTRLAVRGLTVEGAGPVDFAVAKSEIVGLVGLRGAGQERVGRALFGVLPHGGEVLLDGETPLLDGPGFSDVRAGIGAHRARPPRGVRRQRALTIPRGTFINPGAIGRGFASPQSPRREASLARGIAAQVGLRPNDPHLPIEALSGGNQQKVIVGRWLRIGGRVLIAEDPTAGVDVGAKAEVYRLLDEALATGLQRHRRFDQISKKSLDCVTARWCFRRGVIVAEEEEWASSIERLIHAASVAASNATHRRRVASSDQIDGAGADPPRHAGPSARSSASSASPRSTASSS